MDEWTIRELTTWANLALRYVNGEGTLLTQKGELTDYARSLNEELEVAETYVRWLYGG